MIINDEYLSIKCAHINLTRNTMNKKNLLRALLGTLAASALIACQPAAEQAVAHSKPPAPQITVAQVISERVTEWDEFTGRLEAPQTVALRPRVSGYIEQVVFKEGALVKAGQILFKIDAKPFTAQVNRLKAEVTDAKSQALLAKRELQRGQRLKKQNAISQEELDNRLARQQQSAAHVQSQIAALATAQLDLDYTKVKAPISGRISRAFITKGNYVTAGQSELTSLVSTDKVYAYFDADERTFLSYMQQANATDNNSNSPVMMGLAIDNGFPYNGHIDFIDNHVNRDTGTIRGRAVFDNSDGRFTPGLFARMKLVSSASYQGILIDDKAISTDLNNKFVLVLDQDNMVQYRRIVLGQKNHNLRLIKEGLVAGDIIVVKGLQRVRPGTLITPKQIPMADEAVLAQLKQQQQRIDAIKTAVELAASLALPLTRG